MAQPNINYQKELETILANITAKKQTPSLLLHSCCAPCSSYVLEYLTQYFTITVLYYNPNIAPIEEYEHRKAEQIRLIKEESWKNPVTIRDTDWDHPAFASIAKGMEELPEGGARCLKCYELRLRAAARAAKEGNYDYFTSTLSISPLKNAQALNKIGFRLSEEYHTAYLPADFKKRGGYQRSIELSRQYNLYRQDYCGCIYSKRDRILQKREQQASLS
ncbi:epoxyqueuosine reductase QueH [Ructibacterium gallinarum]|uniref:Epoxyqueuosine reductase QueH n=1 Tax=Ructibacterium gallinarum TaxID=2779355 RepID=A0A9D5R8U8_9FIRM|nr:epoxyqueuosine reductase QueH [Ructibacterium gallinarum]MBE5039789.1 epoxyqueuosine reductase QueH [Ructibacterium gallinarum]